MSDEQQAAREAAAALNETIRSELEHEGLSGPAAARVALTLTDALWRRGYGVWERDRGVRAHDVNLDSDDGEFWTACECGWESEHWAGQSVAYDAGLEHLEGVLAGRGVRDDAERFTHDEADAVATVLRESLADPRPSDEPCAQAHAADEASALRKLESAGGHVPVSRETAEGVLNLIMATPDVEEVAKALHEACEKLAPDWGFAPGLPWDEADEKHKSLTRSAVYQLIEDGVLVVATTGRTER